VEYQLPNLIVGAITEESIYGAFENGITAEQVMSRIQIILFLCCFTFSLKMHAVEYSYITKNVMVIGVFQIIFTKMPRDSGGIIATKYIAYIHMTFFRTL